MPFWDSCKEDIRAVFDNDPAARSMVEVTLTYPGLHAIWMHRFSHCLYEKKRYTLARIVSHLGRFLTGVEIHPGAKIGKRVFIDHGMGIVIGETSEIGDECLLYKGVVLGGTSLEKKKRHPTLGKGVVVGSNACVLGSIHVGDGARIGSGSVVIKDVPPGATVVGVPGKIVKRMAGPESIDPDAPLRAKLSHADLPDPLIEVLEAWMGLLNRYEDRIKRLEDHHEIKSENLAEAFRSQMPLLSDELSKSGAAPEEEDE